MSNPIKKLLIANRGEIASRIIRTAHNMGISTVAVYADGDARDPFVRDAGEKIALRGHGAAESYLCVDKLLEAARLTGADAVHPGYGFLAENAAFAQAVVGAGLNWVGPSAKAIAAMGDKLSAKRLMADAGVPQLSSADLSDVADAQAMAEDIGYPLLVKASAGGGGKGMRVVDGANDLVTAIEGARREAGAAFGDDTVFLERWLTRARHVEIQVLGDQHGNLVHCFDRECSIQRRHQKIIEEAPSPGIDDALRQRMAEAALAAARAIDYYSTGTVEFLVQDDQFWFLEMNTRLQVEHPVTEAITGLDLVREQLRVAQGEVLSVTQEELAIRGHAIEARLYAEDPANDFLPATGEIVAWQPSTDIGIRFDVGIDEGARIGIEFDPLLAKVTAHAPTRKEAAAKLARALETTRLQGVTNNRQFLIAALRSPTFLKGDTTTDFINRVPLPTASSVAPPVLMDACIAAAIASQEMARQQTTVLRTLPSGWRNSRMPLEKRIFSHANKNVEVHYRRQRDDTFVCQIEEQTFNVQVLGHDTGSLDLEIDNRQLHVSFNINANVWYLQSGEHDVTLRALPRFPDKSNEATAGGLSAPMPGRIVSVHVAVGDHVEAGQLLMTLEAMKMEHRITAPVTGKIVALPVEVSQQVSNGELLVIVED